jgi:hypothetical protein
MENQPGAGIGVGYKGIFSFLIFDVLHLGGNLDGFHEGRVFSTKFVHLFIPSFNCQMKAINGI